GPAVDAANNVFLITGNGPFEAPGANGRPAKGDYSQSFLKLQSNGSTLGVADYFAMWNGISQSQADADLGSAGGMLLPQLQDNDGDPVNVYVGAGKDGNLYLVDQNDLGGFSTSLAAQKARIYQEVDGIILNQLRGTPAYFNNHLYFGPRDIPMRSI